MGCPESFLASPLLFRSDLAITDTCVDAAAQRLALSMRLREFARLGRHEPFLYRAATVSVGDLVLSTGFHGPMQVVTEETPRATVILALGGDTTFSFEGGALHFGALNDLAYLPGFATEERSEWISGVLFSIDVDRLGRTAAAMAGCGSGNARIRRRLQQPLLIRPRPGSRELAVVQHLRRLFTLFDAPRLDQDHLLEHLGLDDLLYRALAMAIVGDLIHAEPQNLRGSGSTKEAIINDLLDWIAANIDRPISLSELEQRSSYSQRTLRSAFQERFGCGPHEWICRQRMEAARQQLLSAELGDTVATVARRLGYVHPSQFSRDFARVFGMAPSSVLRQGRRFKA
ncbi:MAG: AraC family transcriptional regulator [Cyanobium sp.]|nr:AraC family transcriptional regulator [Cyanobium sp.]